MALFFSSTDVLSQGEVPIKALGVKIYQLSHYIDRNAWPHMLSSDSSFWLSTGRVGVWLCSPLSHDIGGQGGYS